MIKTKWWKNVKLGQKPKTVIVKKTQKFNKDLTQKLKFWQHWKPKLEDNKKWFVTKLKKSNSEKPKKQIGEKTQQLKLWQNQNCEKTQKF